MKTSDLIGPALDWAVAKIEKVMFPRSIPKYSSDWAQGGPIIEREEIEIGRYWNREPTHHAAWKAQCGTQISHRFGPTPLVAAMRCYVASKLGDEITIPKELL